MKMATKKNGNGNGNGRLPAVLADAFAEDTGIGFEEVTSNDIQIPFVRILQAMSPQIKKSDPAFISGATQGDIFDTVTNEVWSGDKGIVVLPVYFQTKYLEFASNSNDVQKAVRDQDSGMELLENGNELVRSAQHYVKICHKDGTLENAIVDMKKTQLKKSRLWLSMMMMQKHKGTTLPIFATTYRLKTIEDGNDKGSWYTWTIAVEGRVSSIEAYNDAKQLHGSIKSGELRIAPPPPEPAVTDEDIPF